MTKEAGLADPVSPPDQPENLYSEPGVAEIDILCPLSYQFVPEGLTVPAPEELTEVAKLYWVVKLAVYAVLAEGAVIVRFWAPPSLQEEKTYRVPVAPLRGEGTERV